MINYFLKRILNASLVVFGVLIITFILVYIIPGDPTSTFIGQYADRDTIEALKQEWGLNKPILQQFLTYLLHTLHGDLGKSYFTQIPVLHSILSRLPVTFLLALMAILIGALAGIPIGIFSAIQKDRWYSRTLMNGTILGISLPVFWAALLLLLIASKLDTIWPLSQLSPMALSILLGAIVLGIRPAALISRLTRTQMLDVMHQDFVLSAYARGIHPFKIYLQYAFRNCLSPILSTLALDFGSLLSGAVITETIFGIPGLGKLALSGLGRRDYPVIMGMVLFTALVFVLINLCVDLTLIAINTKLRGTENKS
ncbi:MAG: ABC transporter permease [Chlamydiota bacterium]|nr:ABC transporter permease [Chlamydiota bacterium]